MAKINGKEVPLAEPVLLSDYLEQHQYRIDTIAVELNEEIIPKNLYGETVLKDGDCLEIVHFMGGGSGLSQE